MSTAQEPGAGGYSHKNHLRRKMSRRRLELLRKKKHQAFQPDFHGLEKRMMPSTFTVTDTSDSDANSLRQAILNSNATPGSNTIDFNIPSTGVQTISLLSGLPAITVPVDIDGTSQPGYSGTPLIDLDGGTRPIGGFLLQIGSGGSTISALNLSNLQQMGIEIFSDGNVVQGSYLGTNAAGTALATNFLFQYGIEVLGSNNTIGGLTSTAGSGPGNLISGVSQTAVVLGGASATGNLVEGNEFGTNAAGTAMLGSDSGVWITDSASGNTIGGTAAGAGNLISGNGGIGVLIKSPNTTGNLIEGNKIGTDITGTAAIGNEIGVEIQTSGNTVGGSVAGAGNLISGNTTAGIDLDGATDTLVQGNLIGTNVNGTAAIANATGVLIETAASGNTIGGLAATPGTGAGNVISGNTAAGVQITGPGATGNVVAGDLIGTDYTGMLAVANFTGVQIDTGASGNLIGSNGDGVSDALERNLISGNENAGVRLTGAGTDTNVVAGNWIGTNLTGSTALGNGGVSQFDSFNNDIAGGVVVENGASDNLIGTSGQSADDAGERNVISGNASYGLDVNGAGTAGNVFAGNFIGTDPTGTASVANARRGVEMDIVTSTNWVGVNQVFGPENADEGNVVSGNAAGILAGLDFFGSSGIVVAGNLIGVSASGIAPVPDDVGIVIDSSSSILIGTSGQDGANDSLERNVIFGRTQGILFENVAIPGALDTTGNVVAGNLIGTTAGGNTGLGAADDIKISDGAYNNWIGVNPAFGPENADQRNVISGSTSIGVEITGAGTTGNVVAGNDIGTDLTGTLAVPNQTGVEIDSGATANRIGSDGDGVADVLERNIISGNSLVGVLITGSGTSNNVVAGDYIGTTLDGSGALPNGSAPVIRAPTDLTGMGIAIEAGASGNRIGTAGASADPAGERNVISGNDNNGVEIGGSGSHGNLIAGNFIGLAASGTAALGNDQAGILLYTGASGNTIGGLTAALRNVIGGNANRGMYIFTAAGSSTPTTANVIEGNYIGTDATGMVPITGNSNDAISIDLSPGNIIGGTVAGAGNVLSAAGDSGVFIYGDSARGPYASAADTLIAGNIIGLAADGVTATGFGNAYDGIAVDSAPGTTIGGSVAAARNIISNNTTNGGEGILITNFEEPDGAYGTVVQGNFIGTDITGTLARGNNIGVDVEGASSSLIGTDGQDGAADSVEGNLISGNISQGIRINAAAGPVRGNTTFGGAADNVVAGNLIGTNAAGTAALGNGAQGVQLVGGATDDWIGVNAVFGAEDVDERNIIASSASAGVELSGAGTTANIVAGDYLGTDSIGTHALPNYAGVEIDSGASGNLIGTNGDGVSDALERNILSGNLFAGVWITFSGTNQHRRRQHIGTTASGSGALGNGSTGFSITSAYSISGGVVIENGASNNLIGTTGQSADDGGERNIISGSFGDGIDIFGSGTSGNVVAGNFIGTNTTGTAALANPSGDGVFLAEISSAWIGVNSVYGPENADQANVISASGFYGVQVFDSTGTVVAGNLIGTNASGTAAIPNPEGVVLSDASTLNLVGTTGQHGSNDVLERNVISGNTSVGVFLGTAIAGGVSGVVTGNVVAGNYIGTNASGTAALGNGGNGVEIFNGSTGNWIGFNSVYGPGNTDDGNVLSGNSGYGVDLTGAGTNDNVVAGNYAGTNATGAAALGNSLSGVGILGGASRNTIGGTAAGARNVLSGNHNNNESRGIYITNAGTDFNVVIGNYIGTNAAGTAAVANDNSGILVSSGADNNTIGGPTAADRNLVSGNTLAGIAFDGTGTTGNVAQGNWTGLNAAGTGVIADLAGIAFIDGSSGNSAIDNVVSGNTSSGISIINYDTSTGSFDSLVQGNLIGTDPTGLLPLGNEGPGVDIYGASSGNTIGGTTAAARNIISANAGAGVSISGTGTSANLVIGNYVGTNAAGAPSLGNSGGGVEIATGVSGNTIGGLTATPGTGAGNLISGNTGPGIVDSGVSNLIAGNLVGTNSAGTAALANQADGIDVYAGGDTIGGTAAGSGNVVSGNTGDGIAVQGAGNVVDGNMLGTNAAGTAAVGNNGEGVVIFGNANTIGGTTAGSGNVISGNQLYGINFFGGASDNLVAGNKIGTDVTGTANLGNALDGVEITDGSTGNTIGGATLGAGNVISGNIQSGIVVNVSANLIAGNKVGTNAAGTAALPNGFDGIDINAGGNTIGGTTSAAGNVISGNDNVGVQIFSGTGTVIAGNLIGTDAFGTIAVANQGQAGVYVLSGNNTIGGTTAGAGNVISGNSGDGVEITGATSSANVVAGNWIGTNPDGTVAVANLNDGIYINQSSDNTIGGTSTGAANLISGNTNGVELSDASDTVVQGNLIGLDQTGSISLGNFSAGVLVDNGSSTNTIGGPVGGGRNFISGNAQGVYITGAGTTGNLVAGNFIGTDMKGVVAVGNLGAGIVLAGGTATTIGGPTTLARNLISGNDGDGLDVQGGVTNTLIEGNYVGLDQTGTKTLANAGDGVSIDAAPGTIIGGTAQGAGNVIAGNAQAGLSIAGGASPAALVIGNRIGTDFTATSALGNGTFGILITGAPGVTIGGTSAGSQNIISGNSGAGIGLYAGTTGASVQGNLIGTDATGSNPLGNATGIQIDGGSANNTIGGTAAGAGNTIAFATGIAPSAGIGVDVDSTAGAGNLIRLNAIFSNRGLGIDLGGDGVTLNDSVAHTGPNDHQNFPVITVVTSSGGTTTVTGTLASTESTSITLDFYTLSSLNASGYGEGHTVLGSLPVLTDGAGNASFSFSCPTPAGGMQFVSATATDSSGNSSEFSKEFGVDDPPTARIGFTTLTVNEGSPVSFNGSASTSPDGDPLSYAWTFGDTTTATGPDPTHTYLAPGTDTVTLTVNDGFGGTSTAQATITVVDVPPVFTPDSFTPPLTYVTAAPGNGFGTTVSSVDGNVAIGAPSVGDTGAVYLYDGVPTDDGVSSTYVYGSLIHAFADPNPAPGDQFGASLAVVGNELVVGAPGSSLSGTGNGVAYVFDANSDSTTFGNLLATLTVPAPVVGTGAHFGASVGTTNTNIVIGAPGTDGGQGEVYEFEGDTTQANFGDKLLAVSTNRSGSEFGAAVAGIGDNLIVGAPLDVTGGAGAGSVYVIDGTTGGLLTTIDNPDAGSGFGSAVASVGANILIGSPFDGTQGTNAGAAFLFVTSSSQLDKFTQPFIQPGDGGDGNFGASVAGTDNTAFIGAPGATLGTGDAGAAYLLDADPASPTFGQTIAAVQEHTPTAGDLFGAAVGFDYGSLIVGAAGAGSAGAEAVDLYQPGASISASSVTTYATASPNNSVIVSGTFIDANPSAALRATIDWGDGTPDTMLDILAGSYAFSAPHDYLTDAASRYNIGVTLTDGSGNSAFAQTTIAISDPAPEFAAPGLVLSSSSIDENGSVTASGTIVSPGGIHTNTVSIDWGDGSTGTTIVLAPGDDTFSSSHIYLNNPAGVTSGSYAIDALVTNDEGKTGTADTSVTIENVAPQFTAANLSLSQTTVTEGDTITLDGQFTDPGTLDPHTATIDWGDGSTPTVLLDTLGQIVASATPGLFTYSAAHQYLNNPPGQSTGGTYTILVSVSDDVSTTSVVTSVDVNNAPPTIRIESAGNVGSGTITLTGVVTDPGVLDTETLAWTLTVDGTASTPVSGPTFTFTLPASFTTLVVTATATDSDGGTGSDSAQIAPISIGNATVTISAGGITVSSPTTTTSTTGLTGANEVIVPVYGSGDTVNASTLTAPVELDGYGSDETLTGGSGDDLLTASGGDNSLVGGAGNDTLVSSGGNDSLFGGAGNDTYFINPGPDPLVNDSTGFNTLNFSISAVPITLNLSDNTGQQQVVYSSNGVSYVVSLAGTFDGFVGSPQNNNVTLNDGNDLIYGGAGNSTITGGTGNNSIVGGSGNDIIYGGTGNTTISSGGGQDSITGGSGNDIIYGGAGNSTITGGGGSTTIVGGSGNDIIYGGANSSTLTGGNGNDSISGGSGNDIIYGGGGNNTITGGSGNNSIVGGSGNDIIYGGNGNTTITGGGGSSTIVGGSGNDIIYGGASSSTLTGGMGNNSITGGSGNDIIYGGGGNNTISGGSGNNSIVGGSGNDIIYGGSGNTTITGGGGSSTIVGGSGNDIIYGGASSSTLTGGMGNVSITGGSGNDIIYGGIGNNVITGGAGNDSIVGGGGNDLIYGGSGNTTITGGGGNDSISGGSGNDIIYGGASSSTLTGGMGNNSITGGSGNDIIYGGGGNNTISGGSGDDSIVGGTGDDIIYGGAGNTTITGGGGNDSILGGSGNDIIYGGASSSTLSGGSGNDSITGGSGNDIIYGGGGNNTITGGSGNDSITGGGGNDIIYGGSGNTTITGGGGNSSITGGSGNDIIFAVAGDNTLTGGSGDDAIFGGSDNDTIEGGTGNDTIVGGQGHDSILGGSGDDIIFGGTLTSTLTGGSGNDSIFGSNGNDIIYGGTGNSTITGGTGNESITGGSGNDIIYGGPGANTISGGGGNVTIVGGVGYDSTLGGGTSDSIFASNGNDVLTGSGFDSWLLDFGSQNMTLTNTALSTSGGGLPASVSTISGFQNVLLAAGTGNFTLDASGFSGSAILQGGTGDDTLIGSRGPDTLEGGAGNDSLVGGGAGDTFAFNSSSSGSQTVVEPQGTGVAGLDFSQAPAGVSINLSQSGPQAVIPGTLTLTLADPLGVDSVLGSSYDDTLIGNANDNTLIGGGGDDLIAGLGGNDVLEGSVTRTVFLDFNTYELPGQHLYTPTERDLIQAQMEADFGDFSYTFTQTVPQSGPYTTITFNDPVLVGLEGGIASEIDWRELDISGTTILTASGLLVIPADSAAVNVNNFLGAPGEPAATSADFVGISATIAAHELGHLSGLEHGDSYGPIGSGIYDAVSPARYNPPYPGATDADETVWHIMASGDSVHSTLFDAVNDPFFGEREAIKLAFGEDGSPTNEQSTAHDSMASAQPLVLAPLVVPDTDLEGTNADTVWNVTAADVVGDLGLAADGLSETDYYSFTATAGTLINFEVMSVALTRAQGPFDTALTIFNSAGQVIAYNDDSFQDADSTIIDLTLPYTGTYYAMVTSSPKSVPLDEPLTGAYELFIYTFATGSNNALSADSLSAQGFGGTTGTSPGLGDTMYAGSGDDTIIAGAGDDSIAGLSPEDVVSYGSGTVSQEGKAPYIDVTAGPNQTVSQGESVTLTGSFIDPDDAESHTYLWSVAAPGEQSVADGTGPSFTFTAADAGIYTVTYTVSDLNGGTASVTVQVTSTAVQAVLTAPAGTQNAVEGENAPLSLGSIAVQSAGSYTVTCPVGRQPVLELHTFELRRTIIRSLLFARGIVHHLGNRHRRCRQLGKHHVSEPRDRGRPTFGCDRRAGHRDRGRAHWQRLDRHLHRPRGRRSALRLLSVDCVGRPELFQRHDQLRLRQCDLLGLRQSDD